MPRSCFPLLASALLAACAAPPPTPEDVVAAERAFAQDGYDLGFKASFLKHSADDAIVLQPGPVNAHRSLNTAPDDAPGGPKLIWWPLYAGVSKSADLGFTTGPYAIDDKRQGHYFTVWKKQADGSWKWLIDAGVGADPAAEAAQGADVSYLPVSREKSASPDEAFDAVVALEAEIANGAAGDYAAALTEFLDEDSRLHSDGPPPAKTAAGREAAFKARPPQVALTHLGGGASGAGDLAWTYGSAVTNENGTEKTGYYLRIWQKRADGWRIVFDEHVPARG